MNIGSKKIEQHFIRYSLVFLRSFYISRFHFAKNHYDTLKLSKTCSAKEIRDAYIKLSKEYHPDRSSSSPDNHLKFVELNEAYSVLSKPGSRRSYDETYVSRNQGKSHSKSNDYTVCDFGDATSHSSFREYYYRAHMQTPRSQEKPKAASLKFVLFLIVFSLAGGLLQFYIVGWIYRNSYKTELKKYKLLPAEYLSEKEFREKLAQEKARRSVRSETKE